MPDSSKNSGGKRFLSSPPPSLGRNRVGRYDVIHPIAQGGMAGVYVGRLAGMAGFERLVAIKVIHSHLANQREFVEMFLDEARLAARIHHPNVGEIFEVGEDDGLYFMVGELIQGQSQRSFYRRAQERKIKVPHSISADMAARVCQGLHAAHELKDEDGKLLNVVHRDISPRNVLLSYDGFVKLIDFGVAWAKDRLTHTDAGMLKGKIGYMPPEQIRGESLDRRSDLFSLGVVLYLMFTGHHPFHGANDGERLNKIINNIYIRPRKANPEIDEVLENIIVKALSGPREKRYQTAQELGEDLEAYVRKSEGDAGTTALSRIMLKLFDQEFLDWQEELRAYRRLHKETSEVSRSIVLEKAKTAGSRAQEGLVGKGGSAQIRPAILDEETWTTRFRRLRLAVGGAILGAVVLATVVVVLATSSPQPSSPKASEPRSPPGPAAGQPEKPETPKTPLSLPTKAPEIKVSLDVTPASATVVLDGVKLSEGETSFLLAGDGKPHKVEISARGYEEVTETILAVADQELKVRLKRKGKGKRKKPPKGTEKEPPPTKKEKSLKLKNSPYQ